LLAGLTLAGCDGQDHPVVSPSSTATDNGAAAGSAGASEPTSRPTNHDAMTLTIRLNPAAVWDDGRPITSADLACTWRAQLNTPGSSMVQWNNDIRSIDSTDPHVAIVHFASRVASYKTLFSRIIRHDAVKSCDDISGDFQSSIPFSGRPWKQQLWSQTYAQLVPNTRYWEPDAIPSASSVTFFPKQDLGSEIDALNSGEVSLILPQDAPGLGDSLANPHVTSAPAPQVNYESLYFQQKTGPFSDPVFRRAFSSAIDRDFILQSVYAPIAPGGSLLQCGLWVPTMGSWCDQSAFANSYDPDRAAQLLTGAGWKRGADGYWADPSGNVPTIRWVVNSGNHRREEMQRLLIPRFATLGFKVVADNADSDTVFLQRLPDLDYELTTVIRAASPDPSVTAFMSCDAIGLPGGSTKGQNLTGWCSTEATQLMKQSDEELDEAARLSEIRRIGQYLVDDAVLLPLYQFSNVLAWRTDTVGGPVAADAANYRSAFNNMNKWTPLAGAGLSFGAEGWPVCLNPVTDCGDSLWTLWSTIFPVLPNVWDTTADGTFVPTSLVVGEPVVTTG